MPLGDQTRADLRVEMEEVVEKKSGGQRQIILALVALLGAGGAGSAGGFFGQSAMAESEVRTIAKEAAQEVLASDAATDKMQEVIEESPVIGKIKAGVEANERAIERVQGTSDVILEELRAQKR